MGDGALGARGVQPAVARRAPGGGDRSGRATVRPSGRGRCSVTSRCTSVRSRPRIAAPRSPGHSVRHTSRWPLIVQTATLVPAGYARPRRLAGGHLDARGSRRRRARRTSTSARAARRRTWPAAERRWRRFRAWRRRCCPCCIHPCARRSPARSTPPASPLPRAPESVDDEVVPDVAPAVGEHVEPVDGPEDRRAPRPRCSCWR